MADADHITTPGKSPAFQFYPSDFTAGTVDLSAEDVGAYMRLLCYQWNKGTVPGDMTALGRIAGLTTLRMKGTWSRIKRHFSEKDGGYINRRLEKVRQGQIAYSRRQSDKGKASAAARAGKQPDDNHGSTAVDSGLQPKGNSSIFGLQALPKKIAGDPATTKIAEDLMEIYPEVFAQCRASSVYRTTQVTLERDWPNYYALAELYPDVKKLRAMLEIFLTRDMGDKSRPGTPGQFRHMAPECDEILRRSGWKATA